MLLCCFEIGRAHRARRQSEWIVLQVYVFCAARILVSRCQWIEMAIATRASLESVCLAPIDVCGLVDGTDLSAFDIGKGTFVFRAGLGSTDVFCVQVSAA